MFDKIGGTAARPPWLHVGAAAAAAAAHVLLGVGITTLPARVVEVPQSVESATFLVLFQADRAPSLPARTHAGPGTAAQALREHGGRDDLPRPLRVSVPPVLVPESGGGGAAPQIVPAPAADGPADLRAVAALASAFHVDADGARRAAALRPGAGGRAADRGWSAAAAGADVVAAEMLAELPRLANRREITHALQRMYRMRLRDAGVQGEVTVRFIIGMDGHAEMASLRILQATHPDLVQPSLRAVERMRFQPARLAGEPVRVLVTLPVTWVLRE